MTAMRCLGAGGLLPGAAAARVELSGKRDHQGRNSLRLHCCSCSPQRVTCASGAQAQVAAGIVVAAGTAWLLARSSVQSGAAPMMIQVTQRGAVVALHTTPCPAPVALRVAESLVVHERLGLVLQRRTLLDSERTAQSVFVAEDQVEGVIINEVGRLRVSILEGRCGARVPYAEATPASHVHAGAEHDCGALVLDPAAQGPGRPARRVPGGVPVVCRRLRSQQSPRLEQRAA